MADSTKYNRFVLKFSTPYARSGEDHTWSLKFSTSGNNLTAQADADAAALALAQPALRLATPRTGFVGYSYYVAGSAIATFTGTYAQNAHPGTLSAYTGSSIPTQLEVCVLARVRVGTSSKGKPTYLTKHIHDVQMSEDTPGALPTMEAAATVFAEWDTGAGSENLVPCSPTTGDQPTTPWEWDTALYTRQLRQGQKGKA